MSEKLSKEEEAIKQGQDDAEGCVPDTDTPFSPVDVDSREAWSSGHKYIVDTGKFGSLGE